MFSSPSKAFVVALAISVATALPQPRGLITRAADDGTDNTELIAKLKTDPTVVAQYRRLFSEDGKQLLSAEDLAKANTFDFNEGGIPAPGGQGAIAHTAYVETFPFLIGSGLQMATGTLGPCGVFLPHVHPRANEFFLVVDGEVDFGVKHETGLLATPGNTNPEINGKLKKNVGTLFPQGSIHYQLNNSPDCKPATIVAALSSENPGTQVILQTPSTGNGNNAPRQADSKDFEAVRPLLPPNIVSVIDECLARCDMA